MTAPDRSRGKAPAVTGEIEMPLDIEKLHGQLGRSIHAGPHAGSSTSPFTSGDGQRRNQSNDEDEDEEGSTRKPKRASISSTKSFPIGSDQTSTNASW